MQIKFVNDKKEQFFLGMTSFNVVDKRNVFDEFQEDHDERSETILKVTGKKKLKLMSIKIKDTIADAASDDRFRIDLKEKLINFANFVAQSKSIKATIE